jgi:signal transduction histidine kinase
VNGRADDTRWRLEERVKELTALHRTARLLQADSLSTPECLREVVSLLPAAWQYPAITCARISFQELSASTDGFRTTAWQQVATFEPRSGQTGAIEVCYLEARPDCGEGPFLPEERELIESLADILETYFQRKLADDEIHAAARRLEELVSERTAALEQEVARHRAAQAQIEEYRDRLRELAAELALAEERQRRELATDLHDHVIQEFAFLRLRIQQLRGDAVFCGFERNLEEIAGLLERAMTHARRLIFEISTPILYELGLAAALEWLVEEYQARHHLPVSLRAVGDASRLTEAERVTLFKCTQELLTNALKYAAATQVTVTLYAMANRTEIEVRDNGRGFDPATTGAVRHDATGFGLFSIRERMRYLGGELVVTASPGRGAAMQLILPREAA